MPVSDFLYNMTYYISNRTVFGIRYFCNPAKTVAIGIVPAKLIIALAMGKIALDSLVQLPCLLLMQLFPNRTQIHVITHSDL